MWKSRAHCKGIYRVDFADCRRLELYHPFVFCVFLATASKSLVCMPMPNDILVLMLSLTELLPPSLAPSLLPLSLPPSLPPSQGYLSEFNALYEELQGKGVEVFAVTAQDQDQADKMMTNYNLRFKVYTCTSVRCVCMYIYIHSYFLSLVSSLSFLMSSVF